MEKKGIRTEKGEFNRWIKATNAVIRDICLLYTSVLDSGDFTDVDFKTVGEHELAETRTMDVLLVQPNACLLYTSRCV